MSISSYVATPQQASKALTLLICVAVILLAVITPANAAVGIAGNSPWWTRFSYPFFHASLIHASLNAWGLYAIVFRSDTAASCGGIRHCGGDSGRIARPNTGARNISHILRTRRIRIVHDKAEAEMASLYGCIYRCRIRSAFSGRHDSPLRISDRRHRFTHHATVSSWPKLI